MMPRVFLAIVLLLAGFAHAGDPELLEPEKAFRFSARLLDDERLEIRYQIAPGYYMYRDRYAFTTEPPYLEFATAQLPPGTVRKDEFFGDVQTYRGDMRFVLPLKVEQGATPQFKLKAVSQGCADIGVCYPPQEQIAQLSPVSFSSAGQASGYTPLLRPSPSESTTGLQPQADDALIAQLFSGGFWVLVASFFGFGLLLAFTPCMLPMIPILSGMLVPHGHRLTHARGLALSSAYVFGMAVTYALAGVAAGILGTVLAAALQNQWVLMAFAAIFVLLALAMFGVYDLQLPQALQSRLAVAANRLHGGHFASVFAMGILSALIVGPCVAAPLAGALLYIGQSGDVALGGAALFAMALGMGVPLLVVGASAGALLPKAGPWMETVKRFFGVVLLGVALYLVSPLLPPPLHLFGWAILLIMCAIYLHALDALPPHSPGYRRLFKGVGVIALLVGIVYVVGALSGGEDPLRPLAGLRSSSSGSARPIHFQRIASVTELEEALRTAQGKPVLLDFYADWCVTCKEMERDTFSDRVVQERLTDMVTLQADVTANSDEHKALLKRFRLFGPPGIVFFDRRGREIDGLRVIGFQGPAKFAATLDVALR